MAQMEEERREHVVKMRKMEMEMEQVFEMKVKEKIQKLRDSETEVPPAVTNNEPKTVSAVYSSSMVVMESEFTLLVWFRLFSCSGVMNR